MGYTAGSIPELAEVGRNLVETLYCSVNRARFMIGGGYRLLASANFGELVLGCENDTGMEEKRKGKNQNYQIFAEICENS